VSARGPALRSLILAALGLVAIVEVFPYLWMVSTSLQDMAAVTRVPPTLWPETLHWENYAKAWASGPFFRYAVNNVVQTVGIVVCQLFFGCLAGFAFSKLRFPGRDACFLVVIACLIVPPQVRFVPLYMLFSKVGLLNTYASLIVPYAVSALGTFLIREAFLQVSDDIVKIMTQGGPVTSTVIYVYYIYEQAFQYFKLGRASAAVVLFFTVIVALTFAQWLVFRRRVHYSA
jgi:ABC-type glycerol-3-phosphate transport system permease component